MIIASSSAAAALDIEGLIFDLAFILILGGATTLLFKWLKQPVVLGYIVAGFLASPNFTYLPSVSNEANISFWAEIGIIVLLFSLGLEFSFRKLLNAGGSAVVTALLNILGMIGVGYLIGHGLGFTSINSIFLGCMISMASTTIIIKALNDLGLQHRRFAPLVFAVLIVEDLFAVVMMVVLSSIAINNTVAGGEMLMSVSKLVFFLLIWFVVGVFVLPSALNAARRYLNQETLLVVSMGLCLGMAIFSAYSGFSMALGAFVMGSILAGTSFAERIEHVVSPVKDLFGSVFFISVGMMVDPHVLTQYWWEILILALVVITGMIIFGTLGMLVTGQNLKVAMESGFTLTQVGEFSFIIASLGMSLGVLNESLYPIIVAVSVLTIFTTPYFIKMADGAYAGVEKHLPRGLNFLISRYSKQVVDSNETKQLWIAIIKRYVWRILLYSVILLAEILFSRTFLFPLMEDYIPRWGHLAATVITIAGMLPFLVAMSFSTTKPDERIRLHRSASFYDVPLVAMRIVRYLLALFFITYFTTLAYSSITGWLVGGGCFILIMVFASTKLMQRYNRMEERFMNNLNSRENTRLGTNNNLVDDMHQAYIQIGQCAPFVGDKIKDSRLRDDYGVSISSIQRGDDYMPLPSPMARIFPGDILGVIGSDDQLKKLNEDIEAFEQACCSVAPTQHKAELKSIRLTDSSPIVGMPLGKTNIQKDYYSMIVKVQRGEDEFIQPGADMVLRPGDAIWVVGDPDYFDKMR